MTKGKVNFKVGKTTYQLEIDEPKEMETLHKMIVLSNPPHYCNVCHNTENFKLASNKDKDGNVYVNVVCTAKGCGAKAKLGQYKAGGYFWKMFKKWGQNNEERKYNSSNNNDMSSNGSDTSSDPTDLF